MSEQRSVFRFRWIAALVAVMAVIFSMPLIVVWGHVRTARIAAENEKLIRDIDRIRAELAVSQIESEQLFSNEQIERAARERLALEYPKHEQVVYVQRTSPARPATAQTAGIVTRQKKHT